MGRWVDRTKTITLQNIMQANTPLPNPAASIITIVCTNFQEKLNIISYLLNVGILY